MSDVPGGEHARHARFEEKRTALEPRGGLVRDVCSGENESLLIPFDVRWKPIGVRPCADQEEESLRLDRGLGLRRDVTNDQLLEASIAATADNLTTK